MNPAPGGAHGSDCGSISILVFRTVILPPSFPVMTRFAERLPVAPVPEQFLVTAVWNNVIHNCGLGISSLLQALRTQRVALKKRFACFLPTAAIAALCGRPCYLRVERLVLLTKLCPWLNQFWTAWVSTGDSWFPWHCNHSLLLFDSICAII